HQDTCSASLHHQWTLLTGTPLCPLPHQPVKTSHTRPKRARRRAPRQLAERPCSHRLPRAMSAARSAGHIAPAQGGKAVSTKSDFPSWLKFLPTGVSLQIVESAQNRTRSEELFQVRPGPCHAYRRRVDGAEKRIVFIIRSVSEPSRHYVGITSNMRDRLEWHNYGPCGHTVPHRPWSLVVSLDSQRNVRNGAIFSPSSKRATNRSRSSMTDTPSKA